MIRTSILERSIVIESSKPPLMECDQTQKEYLDLHNDQRSKRDAEVSGNED